MKKAKSREPSVVSATSRDAFRVVGCRRERGQAKREREGGKSRSERETRRDTKSVQ